MGCAQTRVLAVMLRCEAGLASAAMAATDSMSGWGLDDAVAAASGLAMTGKDYFWSPFAVS